MSDLTSALVIHLILCITAMILLLLPSIKSLSVHRAQLIQISFILVSIRDLVDIRTKVNKDRGPSVTTMRDFLNISQIVMIRCMINAGIMNLIFKMQWKFAFLMGYLLIYQCLCLAFLFGVISIDTEVKDGNSPSRHPGDANGTNSNRNGPQNGRVLSLPFNILLQNSNN